MSLDRREFLKFSLAGAGAVAAGSALPLGSTASTSDWESELAARNRPLPYTKAFVPSPALPYRTMTDEHGDYRLYTVTARQGSVSMVGGGLLTQVFGYAFRDASGAERLTVPGPTIRVPQNTRVKLRVKNRLPGSHPSGWPYSTQHHAQIATSTHLHGSASLPQYDGYADDVTEPGEYKDYWYPNHQCARTIWYHDHGVHYTAQNVYSGLAAQYHLKSDWESNNLPQGDYDVPLTISGAVFDADGNLAYRDRDHSGLFGDVILVNGTPWPFMNVQRRWYRFRILAATLSRSFNFRFVNTATGAPVPVWIIGTDGGLMRTPQRVTNWKHAGAERYEVMVDFSPFPSGTIELRNTSNKNNVDYLHTNKVMRFRVGGAAVPDRPTYATPPSPPAGEVNEVMSIPVSASRRTRFLELEHDDGTGDFAINDRTWREVQQSGYRLLADSGGSLPRPGDVEIWEIENKSGGWFHPLHIHLVDFRILTRNGRAPYAWERGPKDTVYVGEGEVIRVLVKYVMPPANYPADKDGTVRSTGLAGATGSHGGRYMLHCHNLPHEDHDMMAQFAVLPSPASGESDSSDNDPIEAARPRRIPADGRYPDGVHGAAVPEGPATEL